MAAKRQETQTGGRAATTGHISGDYALAVGMPKSPPPPRWQWTKLSDVARLETGHTPSRKHPEYWGGDIPWIGIRDATANHGQTLSDTNQHTNELGINNSSARVLPENTVCLSRTASVGYVVVMGRPMATSQDFVNWVCSDQLDYRFLKYVLLAEHRSFLRFASGTTHQTIYFPEVKAFHICLPPVTEQKAIAHILGTLDDKIELNRRMNETLEAMARAIFKSWFVDFDPVRAKMDGRQPPGMDADTAALFPDAFEDSEQGQIPKGWEVTSLAESIEVKHGFAFKGEYFQAEPPGDILLTPGNFRISGGFKGDKFKYYDGPVPEDYVLEAGDLLVTMTDLSKAGDTLGYPAFVPPSHGPRFLHNQRLGRVHIIDTVGENFVYCVLCQPAYRHHVLASASGSTVKHTSPDRIRAFQFARPDSITAGLFERLVGPMRKRIGANDIETRSLSAIRDTLLPKLLTAEIRAN